MGSAIEPFVFATTAMLELSGPVGIARKSSFIALSWTRTLSCISSAYNGHTQQFACPRCTTSPMWLACDTSTRSSLSTCRSANLFRCTSSSSLSTFTSQGSPLQQPSMMRMPTPLPWDVQPCVLSASLQVCSDGPVHPQSPRVRNTSHWQSHQCSHVLLATPTAPTKSAPVEFPSPSGASCFDRDSCDTLSNFALQLPCRTRPLCLHNSRIILAFDPSSCCCKHYPSTANCNSNCVSLTTPRLECFTSLCDTCTNRSTRDLKVSLSRFVETDTTLDKMMRDLAHDLDHPDRQDKHKIRYCLRQISDARV